MDDATKKVIRMLAGGVDLSKVATTLAIVSPELFLELVSKGEEADLSSVVITATPRDDVTVRNHRQLGRKVAEYLLAGDTINAIKTARIEYNLGLKGARDLINAVDFIRVRSPDSYIAPKRYDGFRETAMHDPMPEHDSMTAKEILSYLWLPF